MQQPVAILLEGGKRLHLQHGPIDLIIGAEGARENARRAAFAAACERFDTVLTGLVAELPLLRKPLRPTSRRPSDVIGQRMVNAAMPHCETAFLTPMIAVAGSVADAVLEAMCKATTLRRAYVNNGGDIAVHLAAGEVFSIAMAEHGGADLGRIRIAGEQNIGGVATSGAKGRSFSFGLADSVTVLASSAAEADVAATLIANAVNLPDHPGVRREPANELSPDSDLGNRKVVVHVPVLGPREVRTALEAGRACAQSMLDRGLIAGAALFLQGAQAVAGGKYMEFPKEMEHQDA